MKRTAGIAFLLVVLVALAPQLVAVGGASGVAKPRPLKIRSTLDGKTVLPHKIRWLAKPNIPPFQVIRVDFLIDGKLHWTEFATPFTYGDDGNWLVTSWLTPGLHRFTVRMKSSDDRFASDTVRAQVMPPPVPPAELDGTNWTRTLTQSQVGPSTPSGTWGLAIDKTGWKITDPGGGGVYMDVAYLSPGLLEAGAGISTRPLTLAQRQGKGQPVLEGNGWCGETNVPVDYQWAVSGNTLTLTLAGQDNCGDPGDSESMIWAGTWTRSG